MTDENDRKVFIKNIPYEITNDLLSEWCSTFGPTTDCSIKRDKFGHSRGFAFVIFASIDGHNNICKHILQFRVLKTQKYTQKVDHYRIFLRQPSK